MLSCPPCHTVMTSSTPAGAVATTAPLNSRHIVLLASKWMTTDVFMATATNHACAAAQLSQDETIKTCLVLHGLGGQQGERSTLYPRRIRRKHVVWLQCQYLHIVDRSLSVQTSGMSDT